MAVAEDAGCAGSVQLFLIRFMGQSTLRLAKNFAFSRCGVAAWREKNLSQRRKAATFDNQVLI
jgi:hypothetical protein